MKKGPSLPQVRLIGVGRRHREHGMLVVRVQQLLTIGVEEVEVDDEEIAHELLALLAAQEGGFGQRQIALVGEIEADMGRQIFVVLCWVC